MSRVPRLLVVTDRHQLPRGRALRDVVADCVDAGARTVLLRERDLPAAAYGDLADALEVLLQPVGGRLVVRSPEHARDDRGVHLRVADPQPRRRPSVIGRSVHGAAELRAARVAGCDYVTVSPAAATLSKPGHGPALGPAGVRRLRSSHPCPPALLALGGVEPDLVRPLLEAGAHGVAVMGGVMRSPDPGQVVQSLLHQVHAHVPTTDHEELHP